jgi:hypothetical protein
VFSEGVVIASFLALTLAALYTTIKLVLCVRKRQQNQHIRDQRAADATQLQEAAKRVVQERELIAREYLKSNPVIDTTTFVAQREEHDRPNIPLNTTGRLTRQITSRTPLPIRRNRSRGLLRSPTAGTASRHLRGTNNNAIALAAAASRAQYTPISFSSDAVTQQLPEILPLQAGAAADTPYSSATEYVLQLQL